MTLERLQVFLANAGGFNEWTNESLRQLCNLMCENVVHPWGKWGGSLIYGRAAGPGHSPLHRPPINDISRSFGQPSIVPPWTANPDLRRAIVSIEKGFEARREIVPTLLSKTDKFA